MRYDELQWRRRLEPGAGCRWSPRSTARRCTCWCRRGRRSCRWPIPLAGRRINTGPPDGARSVDQPPAVRTADGCPALADTPPTRAPRRPRSRSCASAAGRTPSCWWVTCRPLACCRLSCGGCRCTCRAAGSSRPRGRSRRSCRRRRTASLPWPRWCSSSPARRHRHADRRSPFVALCETAFARASRRDGHPAWRDVRPGTSILLAGPTPPPRSPPARPASRRFHPPRPTPPRSLRDEHPVPPDDDDVGLPRRGRPRLACRTAVEPVTTVRAVAHFGFDQDAEVRPADQAALLAEVASMKDVTWQTVTATGHTDSVGPAGHNQRLSERRARAVKAYLVGKGLDFAMVATRAARRRGAVRAEHASGPREEPAHRRGVPRRAHGRGALDPMKKGQRRPSLSLSRQPDDQAGADDADQVIERAERRLGAVARRDDDLLERHRGHVAGREHAGRPTSRPWRRPRSRRSATARPCPSATRCSARGRSARTRLRARRASASPVARSLYDEAVDLARRRR